MIINEHVVPSMVDGLAHYALAAAGRTDDRIPAPAVKVAAELATLGMLTATGYMITSAGRSLLKISLDSGKFDVPGGPVILAMLTVDPLDADSVADALTPARPDVDTALAATLDAVVTESYARRDAARVAHNDYGTCNANTANGSCGRALDAHARCQRADTHTGGVATGAETVTRALDVMVADARRQLTEAQRRPVAERDHYRITKLTARCSALVDAYHVSRSTAPLVAARGTVAVRQGGDI